MAVDVLERGTKVTANVTLSRLLGEGAMGSVWVADHKTLETEVAVKFIAEHVTKSRTDAVERFTREATAAAQIKSPHVVQMFDHGVMAGGTPYIVMEMLEGVSLHDRIAEEGPLCIEDTGLMLTHVASALTVAHKLGVIHRDIKPHNIFLIDTPGQLFAKVLDFGVAKRIGEKRDRRDELTEPGTIVGTPQYVSRDLIMSGQHKNIDERVDLWSLAVVAYKSLTGALPFDGDSIGEICTALAAGRFQPPSRHREDLPRRYDRWFARALNNDPAERFDTAEKVAESFNALLDADDPEDDEDEPAERATRVTTPTAAAPRSTLTIGGFVVAGLAIGVAVALTMTRPTETPTDSSGSASVAPSPSSDPAPSVAPVAVASTAPSTTATSLASAAAPPAVPPRHPRAHEVAIAAGKVWMGCLDDGDLDCDDDELPLREVAVDGFYLDRTEVRVVDYARCVVAGYCSTRRLKGYALDGGSFTRSNKCNWEQPYREKHPINCVSHAEAASYCSWKESRLPTEAEWERAARGDDRRRYPWGDEHANCLYTVMTEEGDQGCGKNLSWSAGMKAKDASPFGARDLAGNVREWVADWYAADYYAKAPAANPRGPSQGTKRVARGGSFGTAVSKLMRISNRESYEPSTRSIHVGFRCARTPAN